MKCPSCKDVTLAISDRQGIEIDYCPECRGVWLDRGELDKIIERSRMPQAYHKPKEAGSGQYIHEGDEYYKKGKKHKSFIGELLDF